jgi:hypothetical protein
MTASWKVFKTDAPNSLVKFSTKNILQHFMNAIHKEDTEWGFVLLNHLLVHC